MKVLYFKNTDQRLPEYQIQTSIEEQDGKKRVCKRGCSKQAIAHVQKMEHSYFLLTEKNGGRYVRPYRCGEGMYFDYVSGTSFAQELLEAAMHKDKKHTIVLLEEFVNIVAGSKENECVFAVTPEFERIFGRTGDLLAGQKGLLISDIDVNPDNIIRTKSGICLIDYEWVFEFPIPLCFLVYRNLKEFFAKNMQKMERVLTFMQCVDYLGLGQHADACERMDVCFAQEVHGKERYNVKARYAQPAYFADVEKGSIIGWADREIKRLNHKNEEKEVIAKVEMDRLNSEIEKQEKVAQAEIDRLNSEIETIGVWGEKLGREKALVEDRLSLEKEIYQGMLLQKQQNEQKCAEYRIELERVLTSRSWRVVQKFAKIKTKLLPDGSKHREIAKRLFRKVRPLSQVQRDLAEQRRTEEPHTYKELIAPACERPQVSVVIPVYNQFRYTYDCIKSVIEKTGNVAYEIIVADDVSTDMTKEIECYIKNIKVIHNERNLGFLMNCNEAARQAKGAYIHFLNNDTVVKENWLSSLVELMEKDDEIGLAGSKLIGRDGRLQEAGGIIWRDATGWNYGLGNDPMLPEYNYVKEADYISGASMMIRRNLWEEIGGFDERYIPAYFEDTDLAFEVRRHGYKVIYQPLSEVIHFEGVSNGTDEKSGIKQYQAVNRNAFREKWLVELDTEHFENAQNVFCARDRSNGKRVILVVDHYVPHFDKDAGSRAVFLYLKMFVDMGMNVKFIGDNFYKHEPYTTILEQMGIEVLYGETYAHGEWKKWIDENGKYIDVVFLNRPHIACDYIDYMKEKTAAKVVYFGHDLHFLREMREYEITKDEELKKSARTWRVREYDLMSKADTVVMLSTEEKRIIKEEFDIDVTLIPIFYFKDLVHKHLEYSAKKDILFVGGFAHRPNVDGMRWFVDGVWPKIKNKLPHVKFNVVGSNPTEEVLAMANDDILVRGFVSDEELAAYYRDSRVCVIPLRYGAGIKGKTIEAMYNQISIVSTGIGIEGLPEIEKTISAADDGDAFASQVVEKYESEERLKKDSENELCYIRQHFSYDATRALFEKIF